MINKIFFLIFISSFSILITLSSAEEITITTYYPAPYGSYKEQEVSERLRIGTQAQPANEPAGNRLEISSKPTDMIGANFAIRFNDLFGFRMAESGATNLHLDWFNGGWQTTPMMTWDRGTGNVGIGTGTTDLSRVQVDNDTYHDFIGGEAKLQVNNYSSRQYSDSLVLRRAPGAPATQQQGILFVDGNSMQAAIRAKRIDAVADYNNSLLFFTGNGADTFQDDTTAKMAIDYTGNVGIGIGAATPSQKLEVAGNIHLSGANPSTLSAPSIIRIDIDNNNNSTLDFLDITHDNGASLVRIQEDGNVGIGTTNPLSKLSVRGDGRSDAVIYGDNSGMDYSVMAYGVYAKSNYAGIYGEANYPLVLRPAYGVYGKSNNYGVYCDAPNCGGSVAWSPPSDKRLKKNITTIENALEKTNKLRGVTFEWKDERRKGKQIGFIGQEVKEVLPEVIGQDPNGYYTIASSEITALLVEAIKEQQKQIEALKTEIKSLKQEIKLEKK